MKEFFSTWWNGIWNNIIIPNKTAFIIAGIILLLLILAGIILSRRHNN